MASDAKTRDAREGSARRRPAKRQKRIDAVGSTRVRDRARLSERITPARRRALWLRSTLPDFLLVLVVSCALAFTVSYGFESAWAYRGNWLLIAVMDVPLLIALFAGTWSKRAVLPSALATAVVAIAYVAIAGAISPDPGLFADGAVNDVQGNYTIFALVVAACATVAFLLSRRTVGLVFLLLFVVVACGAVQYLWREWTVEGPGLPAFIAAFLGVDMLFVYQCYKQSVYSANRVKSTSFPGAFAFSGIVAAACTLVAAAVFLGVVTGIGLTTPDFRPFETHVSPPIDEQASLHQERHTEDDTSSEDTDDNTQETGQEADGGDSSGRGGFGFLENTFVESSAQALSGFDPDDPDSGAENIYYLILWETVILSAFVVLIALAAILLQRARRGWRLRRIANRSGAYQVWYLYTFLLGRLRRMRVRKPAHLTPLEFAVGFSKPMLPFTRGTGGVDFVEVSDVYQDAVYGGMEPSSERLERVRAYYRAFFKNARSYVGWPRWILYKFWRV